MMDTEIHEHAESGNESECTEVSRRSPPSWFRRFAGPHGQGEFWDAGEIGKRSDEIANRLAPDTRRLWRWLLGLQGGAVLAPVLWLMVFRGGLPVPMPAFASAVTALGVVAACWWLRWKRLHAGWTQARVTAEIARSKLACACIHPDATWVALSGANELSAVARALTVAGESVAPRDPKQAYQVGRIESQAAYYRGKLEEARADRQRLGRYVTICLDGSLFLGVAGLALSCHHDADVWLRLSGSDFVLALAGSALPLVAVLVQLLASHMELGRRTGSYARQLDFLEHASGRWSLAHHDADLRNVVEDTERVLLGEVVEWYYQVSQQEPFYRLRPEERNKTLTVVDARETLLGRLLGWFGVALGFAGRVILGRIVVAALAVVLTTALTAFNTPKHERATSRIRPEDGRMLSSADAKDWVPDPARTSVGLLLIAHGLHDGVNLDRSAKAGKHWMSSMQESINSRLGEKCPEICLIDWHAAAVPVNGLAELMADKGFVLDETTEHKLPASARGWIKDVAAIRPQAEEIGDVVGYKLARAIRKGTLRRDRPMHLIGHSAGGFVVIHAAMVLQELGLAPANLRVTLLDTPLPVAGELQSVAKQGARIDYYASSAFAQGVPGDFANFRRVQIAVPTAWSDVIAAHSYAHQWYEQSVRNESGNDGFAWSPFLK